MGKDLSESDKAPIIKIGTKNKKDCFKEAITESDLLSEDRIKSFLKKLLQADMAWTT